MSFTALAAGAAPSAPDVPASPLGPARRAAAVAGRGSLAILDQGLYAGANFILNILLARWLSEDAYGCFALAFSVMLLIGTLHTALFTEPMLVFGAGRYAGRRRKYLGLLAWGNIAVLLPAALVALGLAAIPGLIHAGALRDALIGLAIATPPVLMLWQVRRAFYLSTGPAWAAAGGGLYLVLQVAVVVGLRRAGILSPRTGLIAMGLASLAAVIALVLRLRPALSEAPRSAEIAEVAGRHWVYGRWLLASLPLTWLSANFYYLLLPALMGLAAAGSLRAVMNVTMPALQSLTALSLLLLPALVRRFGSGGSRALLRAAAGAAALYLAGCGLYLGLLVIFHADLFALLYGERYSAIAPLDVLLAGMLPIGAALNVVAGSSLRAMERSRGVFWGYVAAAATTLLAGLPLAIHLGMRGALMGLLLSSFTSALVMIAALFRPMPRPTEAACS